MSASVPVSRLLRLRGNLSAGNLRGSPKLRSSRHACSRNTIRRSRIVGISRKRSSKVTPATCSSEALPASPSPSPVSALGWLILAVSWQSSSRDLLRSLEPVGSSGKTSPACSLMTADERSARSSGSWPSAGMGSPTEFWTHKTSESPSVAAESSLSDILETGDHLRPFFLSPKACVGILSRAERRGRVLPKHLLVALKAVAERK